VNSSKTELFRSSSKEFENSDNFARWLTDTPIGEGKTSQLGSTYKFKRSNSSQKVAYQNDCGEPASFESEPESSKTKPAELEYRAQKLADKPADGGHPAART